MSTVTVYKPHPDPWHAFREDDPLGDAMAPPSAPVLGLEDRARRASRATAPARSTCRSPSPAWAPRTATRAGSRSGTWTRSRRASRSAPAGIPMPYSPIHDDDICAQLEPLLGVASVPATIVNWGGDEPVSVQEYSAYFGELLGVEAEVVVEEIPGASRGLGGRPHEAQLDHRPVPRSAGGRASAAWRSTSIPTASGPTTRSVGRDREPLPEQRRAARRSDGRRPVARRLRAGRLPRGPRRAAREPRARRRPQPRDRRRRDRRSPATPREPPRGRGVVPRASRDRRRSRCGGRSTSTDCRGPAPRPSPT